MQTRNFNDPEQYDESEYMRRQNGEFNDHPSYYNPIPAERAAQEIRNQYSDENDRYRSDRNQSRSHLNNSSYPGENSSYGSSGANRKLQHPRTAYERTLLDRYGNGRRGESIARGNYGLPGTDRFGNVWYTDPRNQGNYDPYPHEDPNRGLAQQFGDELRSWFGDREATRRREMDSRNSLGTAWHDANRQNQSGYYDDERDREWANRRRAGSDNRW